MKKYLIGLVLICSVALAATEWNDMTFKGIVEVDGVQTNNNTLNLTGENEVRFQDTTGGEYIGLKAPGTVSSSETFTLPSADGTNTQCIKTNGSGALSFGDCIAAAGALTVESKTASFTAQTGYAYLVDTSLGDVTATLPASSGESGNSILFYVSNSTNDLIIDGNGSETVDGATTYELRSQYEHITILSDGSNWAITGLFLKEQKSFTSSATNASSSGSEVSLTGNGYTLGSGTWEMSSTGELARTGGASDLTRIRTLWSRAQNSQSNISGITGITLNYLYSNTGFDILFNSTAAQLDGFLVASQKVRITLTQDSTIYVNCIINASTPANFRCQTSAHAKRVR